MMTREEYEALPEQEKLEVLVHFHHPVPVHVTGFGEYQVCSEDGQIWPCRTAELTVLTVLPFGGEG
jgi:hypothetical protein